mgnify:CR=1 FL=1|jgi:hypothetical protein
MNRDDVISIVRQFTGHENIIAVPRILIELTGDPILAMMLNQCTPLVRPSTSAATRALRRAA